MIEERDFDPEHKAWLVTLDKDGEIFDVVVCVSGNGKISHSRVKAAFEPDLVKLVPLMHPVRVYSDKSTSIVDSKLPRCSGCKWENVTICKYCKGWLLHIFLGDDFERYDMLVVASGDHVLCSEEITKGFFSCLNYREPFKKLIRIDRTKHVVQ